MDPNWWLDRSRRYRRHVRDVVTPTAAESVHHRITEPLPESFKLELLVWWTEIEICNFNGKISFEGQPDEDSRAHSYNGKQAATDGHNDKRDRRLVVNLKISTKFSLT